MERRIVLLLPHVGTAYGHLIRLASLVNVQFPINTEIFTVVPRRIQRSTRHLLPYLKHIIYQKNSFSVTSESGVLNVDAARKVLEEDIAICKKVKPNLIVGSPGIRAALIGVRMHIDWIGAMHGCYLPFPSYFAAKNIPGTLDHFAYHVWHTARRGIDYLVRLGSDGRFHTWAALQGTGRIIIPNSKRAEPSMIGIHINSPAHMMMWKRGKPVSILFTTCSAGSMSPPAWLLSRLLQRYKRIHIAGPAQMVKVKGVHYIGRYTEYGSLVNHNTTVVCHGGHGTLKAVRHARRVIVIPGDLDQLFNALVAHRNLNYEIAIAESWKDRLNSDDPLLRRTDWDVLDVDDGSLICTGMDFKHRTPAAKEVVAYKQVLSVKTQV